MPVTDDTIVVDGGAPEAVTIPTVNASLNAWGTILNAAVNTLTTALNYTQGLITAIQAAATALAARVTTLEGETPSGHAGWKSGAYYFGATCEGLEEELVALSVGVVHMIPFDHVGVFSSAVIRGSGSTIKIQVLDSTAAGAPNPSEVLGEATFAGAWSGTKEIAFTSPITVSRPCWLTVLTENVYTRGTTGIPTRWRLGSASMAPSTAAAATTCFTGALAPFTAISLGTKGWGPTLALKAN